MKSFKSFDGDVYAIAQGNLVVGGLGVEGADSSLQFKVHQQLENLWGATVEKWMNQFSWKG